MITKRYRYQIQYACFECRRSFKRPWTPGEQARSAQLSQPLSGRKPAKRLPPPAYCCPGCGGGLTFMGRAFRAPRREDLDQWRKVELLVRNGFTFYSSAGRFPETLSEAKRFVRQERKRSLGERLAVQIRKRVSRPSTARTRP